MVETSGTIIINLLDNLLGNILAFTPTISVSKLQPPTYKIIANKSEVLVGSQIFFTINTTNVPNNTTLYIKNVGNSSSSDFVNNIDRGNLTMVNNTVSMLLTLNNNIIGNDKTIIMNLYENNQSSTILAQSPIIKIIGQTYSITSNLTTVTENQIVIFTIKTTNVPNNTLLYLSNTGTSNSSDFIVNTLPSYVIINNNTASFQLRTRNDNLFENTETIIINLRLTSNSGPIVATSPTVYISDTSKPTPTYTLNSTPSNSIFEGSSVIFNLTTRYVNDGTVLYWTNEGTTNKDDFVENIKSGTLIVNNNFATFKLTSIYDKIRENTETIRIVIRTSPNGSIVATKNVSLFNKN